LSTFVTVLNGSQYRLILLKSLSTIRYYVTVKVAAQLNTHLRINPPCRFEVKYHATSGSGHYSYGGANFIKNTSSSVNSVKTPSSINTNFLFGCIMSGFVSVYALLITALAVASIITLSTPGIFTAVGVVAGVASYCFFKARSGANTTVAPRDFVLIGFGVKIKNERLLSKSNLL
jgi:hypothetical protein